VLSPHLDYDYCKGYYGRATDRLHGRVTRLFVTPLILSLKRTLGREPRRSSSCTASATRSRASSR
jgi:glucosyl-3-phosphoglycerate synthase